MNTIFNQARSGVAQADLPLAQRSLIEMPAVRQILQLGGVAAAIAAALWLVFWSQGQSYSTLYSQLSERETAQWWMR